MVNAILMEIVIGDIQIIVVGILIKTSEEK
jgi:hypothetical protein